jgi:TPP-dependent pyruvate/acetoin dehydrogenase alpha subunit
MSSTGSSGGDAGVVGANEPDWLSLYRSMYRIRATEERIAEIYPSDKIKSPIHLSIGQEAVAVGVCDALTERDIVFGTYRGHAMYLAKGGDIDAMMAELYGKVTGNGRGKSGSMHLIDTNAGVMGTSAIVGSHISNAVGFALAEQIKGGDRVTVVFFGDGASDQGTFHESLNFAALKSLPILFICENNAYAIFSESAARMAGTRRYEKARGYGIEADCVDSGDVAEILEATKAAVSSIRAGGGPRFLECMTWRVKEHVGPNEDDNLDYRPPEDLKAWAERDAVLTTTRYLTTEQKATIEAEVDAEIERALAFAESSPFPAVEELEAHVFAN